MFWQILKIAFWHKSTHHAPPLLRGRGHLSRGSSSNRVNDLKETKLLLCIKVDDMWRWTGFRRERVFSSANRYSLHVIFVVLSSACVRGQCLQDCLSSLSELAENIWVFWTAWVLLTATKNSKAPPSGVDHHPRVVESRGNSQDALT